MAVYGLPGRVALFPTDSFKLPGKIQIMEPQMTLRDQFAMAAMTGDWAAQELETHVFADECSDTLLSKAATMYYRMADAMLEARK